MEISFQKGGLAGGASLIKKDYLPDLLPIQINSKSQQFQIVSKRRGPN